MIRLGIDLNNVLRNINQSFYKAYCEARAMRYQITDERLANLDVYNDDTFFKFKSRKERIDFMFDTAYDIFACAPTMEPGLRGKFNLWYSKVVEYFEDEEIKLVALIPSEGGAALAASLVFLGKGFQFRRIVAPKDSKDCWDECDAIITATPRIIKNCPDDKLVVRISRKFNDGLPGDMTYKTMSEVLKDDDFLTTLVKILNNKKNKTVIQKWTDKTNRLWSICRQKLTSLLTRVSK